MPVEVFKVHRHRRTARSSRHGMSFLWQLLARQADVPAASSCANAAWDDSHFSADQDWVPMTNGRVADGDTLWKWVPAGGGSIGFGAPMRPFL